MRIALALLKLIYVFVSPALLAATLRVGADTTCTQQHYCSHGDRIIECGHQQYPSPIALGAA
jgi:hypothetical protein